MDWYNSQVIKVNCGASNWTFEKWGSIKLNWKQTNNWTLKSIVTITSNNCELVGKQI